MLNSINCKLTHSFLAHKALRELKLWLCWPDVRSVLCFHPNQTLSHCWKPPGLVLSFSRVVRPQRTLILLSTKAVASSMGQQAEAERELLSWWAGWAPSLSGVLETALEEEAHPFRGQVILVLVATCVAHCL